MSYEAVDIFVLEQDGNPIQGVVVRLFDSSGVALTTQGVTDVDGLCSFLLPSGDLTVRCYKFSVAFGAPTTITVLEDQENSFNLYGEIVQVPTASDSRLCTAYGYFRREDGAPNANVDIHIIAKFDPLLLDGSAVMPSRIAVRTDINGYTQVNLIRNGQYDVIIQGDRDLMRQVTIPDLGSVNLSDLLFPVVDRVSFDVNEPWDIPIGSSIAVTPTVYLSDGTVLEGTALNDVTWTSSDNTVMSVATSSDVLTLLGLSAGISVLSASRRDYTIIRIPDSPITGQPVSVTVS
jgi:hypothetical protein